MNVTTGKQTFTYTDYVYNKAVVVDIKSDQIGVDGERLHNTVYNSKNKEVMFDIKRAGFTAASFKDGLDHYIIIDSISYKVVQCQNYRNTLYIVRVRA
jgi:hypothetical protein